MEPRVGAMLPCNVILREVEGGVEVSAIDPVASMQAINNPALHAVAGPGARPAGQSCCGNLIAAAAAIFA